MDLKYMIEELIKVNGLDVEVPGNEQEREKMLMTLRTISTPAKLSDQYYADEKEYILFKRDESKIVDANDITENLIGDIYIYRGDITKLKADAIVNAANEKLLGCFIPGHNCIDNAIHMASGLKLRNACNEIMQKQGYDEPAGKAKLTPGYNIPSRYVFHTVGPNVYKLRHEVASNELEQAVESQLSSCYTSILEIANQHEDIKNVAFCSISTGVYGVPIEFASRVALLTILEYLENHQHGFEKIIINVFSKEDYDEYKKQASVIESGY